MVRVTFLIPPSTSGSRYRYGSGCTECQNPFRFSYARLPYAPAKMPYRSPRSCPRSYWSDRYGSALCLRPLQAGTEACTPWASASTPHRLGKHSQRQIQRGERVAAVGKTQACLARRSGCRAPQQEDSVDLGAVTAVKVL